MRRPMQMEYELEAGASEAQAQAQCQERKCSTETEHTAEPTEGLGSFSWHDITCSYLPSGARSERDMGVKPGVQVLHGVNGHVVQGDFLAVLGPSGAGKSCLLDILSGRKTVGKITGSRYMDGLLVNKKAFMRATAYVLQTDLYHPTSTVKEAVLFQANLRLDRSLNRDVKEELASRLIADVGLKGREDMHVGGPLPGGLSIPGLSGGEKRRLSLCCAMVTHPSLLFLDEPTSGLDASAALAVVSLLRRFSDNGMMIICTIHQPRPAIALLFDKVMVLSKGRLMYFGPSMGAEAWFSDTLGYPRNTATSSIDFILDLVNVSFIKDPALFGTHSMRTDEDVRKAAASFEACHGHQLPPRLQPFDGRSFPSRSTSSSMSLWDDEGLRDDALQWVYEFRIVLSRAATQYTRNFGNVMARLLLMVSLGCFQGGIYWGTGREARAHPSASMIPIMGSLFFASMVNSFLPFANFSLFIYDRLFYAGDSASKLYPPSVYFLSTMVLEVALQSLGGLVYAIPSYCMLDYAAFSAPSSRLGHFATYAAIIMVQANVGSMVVQVSALTAPNQDIAFCIAAAYRAISFLVGGFLLPLPMIPKYARWLSWVTDVRLGFQALMLNTVRGTALDGGLAMLGLTTPTTIHGTVLCSLLLYGVFFVAAFFAVRHLHKEKR